VAITTQSLLRPEEKGNTVCEWPHSVQQHTVQHNTIIIQRHKIYTIMVLEDTNDTIFIHTGGDFNPNLLSQPGSGTIQ